MALPSHPRVSSTLPLLTSREVAVIGAGATGLVAARELRREGHKVVVFERNDKIGGTWIYNPNTESDLLSLDPSRTIVHGSLYNSLRTNLQRESMGFRDYPFVVKEGRQRDPRRFPGHREVLLYLEDFACDYKLTELIRFETEVFYVGLVEEGKWVVKYRRKGRSDGDVDEVYDAVVVCNGHHTEPRIAEIPGIDVWPGMQIHSHNYRVPEPFHDQIKSAHDDGKVVFQDGSSILADVILHCTGYKYDFPFLDTNNIVTVEDNRVGPLYQHVFPPQLAPWLSFIGLPWKVSLFPLFELQSKWVAGVLSGRIKLPSQEEMMSDVEGFYLNLEAAGLPQRYTHNIGDCQFDYDDWLASECGVPASEEWRKQMYDKTLKSRATRPETYRDEWDDQYEMLQAQQDFLQYFNEDGNIKIDEPKSMAR